MGKIAAAAAVLAALPAGLVAQMAHPAGMSHQQVVNEATAGGPASVSANATVGWIDSAGHMNVMRPGTNAFTCVITRPDFTGGPVCADSNAMAWFGAMMSKQAGPPQGRAPGIAYMARGGIHFESADGTITIDSVAGSRRMTEGPHWMMFTALDPATTGLPTKHSSSGTYIMWAGTPWAHLMIMQDPARMTGMGTSR